MKILVVNAGSSSHKLAIYALEHPRLSIPGIPLWQGTAEWSDDQALVKAEGGGKILLNETLPHTTHHKALKQLLQSASQAGAIGSFKEIEVIGQRVVHGGNVFFSPTWITAEVKRKIGELSFLAPLHNPSNLEGIEICEKIFPGTPQVALFDTAFHATLAETASTYPGPYEWKELGIKRYGFHGISHQYCSARCAELLKKEVQDLKIVSCHLGNGSSLAAIASGKSIDTTMGFTPTEGLMMGSRPGSIDPVILIFLQQYAQKTPEELFKTLNFESGLKGISGRSNDMRDILRMASQGDARSKLAYGMYVHHLIRNLGAMIGVLGGADAIVFTAGIGENVPQIRSEACRAFECCGALLDEAKNRSSRPDALVSKPESKVHILVVKTQEDWNIAVACWNLINPIR